MTITAQVLSPYTGAGEIDDPYRPLLLDIWQIAWVDATDAPPENIIPSVNLLAGNVICDAVTLSGIEADSRFLVIWSEIDAT